MKCHRLLLFICPQVPKWQPLQNYRGKQKKSTIAQRGMASPGKKFFVCPGYLETWLTLVSCLSSSSQYYFCKHVIYECLEVILVIYVIYISFLKNNICYSICRFEITVVLVACIVWLNTKKGLKHHDLTFFKSVFNYSHMNIKEIVILFFMSNGCLIILQTSFHSQNFGKTDS